MYIEMDLKKVGGIQDIGNAFLLDMPGQILCQDENWEEEV